MVSPFQVKSRGGGLTDREGDGDGEDEDGPRPLFWSEDCGTAGV